MSATTYANKNATCVSMTSTSGDYKTGNGPTGTYLTKTGTTFAPNDWHNSNSIISSTATRQQGGSLEIRQAARQLRNDTDNKTNWGQNDNTTRLYDRMSDITAWKDKLEQTIADTNAEIAALTTHKERTETALTNMNTPFEVVHDNLATRSIRVSIDLVDDEVNQELNKEVEVINGIKEKLQQKVNEAFQQLCALQDAYNAMCDDLADKMHCLDVDQACHSLTNQSANIGFHAGANCIKEGIVMPDAWDGHSNYNTQRAVAEMKASTALREAINNMIEQTSNDLEAQRLRTEYAFRKRIHEVQMAKDELEWQQRNTKREIDVLSDDIRGLKQAITDKDKPLEVAETRSENRTYRPRVELCRDEPHDGIIAERNDLLNTVSTLIDQHNIAEDAHTQLKQTLNRLDEDWSIKSNSLELEERCMTKRQKLLLVSHNV
ncbi:tektin-B1-like [Bolinopsis microptera]|uniref:tektin-B1-like n=1 Tax=Bolinopsis microptera TaxID=2820187 RepID=UPI0030791E77